MEKFLLVRLIEFRNLIKFYGFKWTALWAIYLVFPQNTQWGGNIRMLAHYPISYRQSLPLATAGIEKGFFSHKPGD